MSLVERKTNRTLYTGKKTKNEGTKKDQLRKEWTGIFFETRECVCVEIKRV
jgi:hypothetical protein